MPRDKESLIDIERAIRRILRYTHNISRAELEINDEKVSANWVDVLVKQLEGQIEIEQNPNTEFKIRFLA
jgi:uncharacterized protein with HEPN domain